MPANTIQFTRDELYRKVWTTSVTKLAAEFHISDVGLAKILKRHKIPKPGRGYWAYHEQGKPPKLKPLPPTGDDSLETITINLTWNLERKTYWETVQPRTKTLKPIPYRPRRKWHPIAKELEDSIRSEFRRSSDWVVLTLPEWPYISASRKHALRVPAALDLIIHQLQLLGAEPAPSEGKEKESRYMTITRAGESCSFNFYEKEVGNDADGYTSDGFLTISVESKLSSYSEGWRRTETPTKTLEQILPFVVARIDKMLRVAEERTRVWREAEQRRQDEIRRVAEIRMMEKIRKDREQKLFDASTDWNSHHASHRYLTEVESKWRETGPLSEAQTKWLAWAHSVNDSRSPFSRNYPDEADVPSEDGG